MSALTPSQKQWIANVTERAKDNLIRFDFPANASGFSLFKPAAFWYDCPNVPDYEPEPIFIPADSFIKNFWGKPQNFSSNPSKNEITFDFYCRHSSDAEKNLFIAHQRKALLTLDEKLLNVGGKTLFDIGLRLQSIAETAGLHRYNFYHAGGLTHYIAAHGEHFESNPTLRVFSLIADLAVHHAHDNCAIYNYGELAVLVDRSLLLKHGLDYSRDRIKDWIIECLDNEQAENLNDLFETRRELQKQAPPLIKPRTVKPYEIKQPSDVNVEFAKQTQRPARGDRREAGGRAGLGAQKPVDLWRPK